MKLSRLGQIIAAAWMFSGMVQAGEVQVPLGNGTLATAIADATDGDTLILGDGSYIGNGELVIDKSLVIRSINRAASSFITADSLTIDAADKAIVLQGLDFGIQVTVLAADDVKVLESQFLGGVDLNVTEYKTTEGDGTLMVIGNHFVPGSLITTINAFDAYIAGNTFDKGHLISNVPVWIVGNYINGTTNLDAININTSGSVQVLANRVFMFAHIHGHYIDGIEITAGIALVAGNIVHLSVDNYHDYVRRGIALPASTYAKVFNNIVDQGAYAAYANSGSSFGIVAYGEVSGNMIINLKSYFNALGGSGLENNLCFNNSNNTCGSNAITADPLLVDRIDYKLGIGSPAIDAGSTNLMLADLDRTRNDIGAYGGPWSIGQYDAQRDPSYFGPYVYPMFKANASFVNGQMQIRAIGIARLR